MIQTEGKVKCICDDNSEHKTTELNIVAPVTEHFIYIQSHIHLNKTAKVNKTAQDTVRMRVILKEIIYETHDNYEYLISNQRINWTTDVNKVFVNNIICQFTTSEIPKRQSNTIIRCKVR